MANLASIKCDFYRIPLPVVTDSTHGVMRAFELNTVQLTDAEGVGYTYTAGRNGAAVHAILERESLNCSAARRQMRSSESGARPGGRCIMVAAAVPHIGLRRGAMGP